MSLPVLLLVVFVVSAMTSLLVAGRLTRVNVKGRHPERSRHWSASGIPRIGGIAVFAAAPIAILAAALIAAKVRGAILQLPELAGSLIVSSAILFFVGLLDDLRGVRPFAKLLAQTAAALIVYRAGFGIEYVSFLSGHTIHLGVFAMPITVLWLVGVSNAFNLIDGLDALAGGVAIIALVAIGIAARILGSASVPVYTVALVGALLGFLKYNWPKARLFMGDSGSLVVGFLLALLAIKGATGPKHVTLALIPIFALAYPLLDTGAAIIRRWLRGVPLSRADLRHVHHQLGSLGLGPKKALGVIYLASAALATLGLLVAFAPPEVTAIAMIMGIGGLFLVIGFGAHSLQYHEFFEAGSSFASAAMKGRSVIQDRIAARDLAEVILRAQSIEEIQALLNDNAPTFRFAYMRLSDPDSRREMPGRITQELQALRLWKLEYPIVNGHPEKYDGLCLTIWCALETSQRTAGAERIAQIIGPAIAAWARNGRSKTAEAAAVDRFIHAREADGIMDLTPEDQLVLTGIRGQSNGGTPLEA